MRTAVATADDREVAAKRVAVSRRLDLPLLLVLAAALGSAIVLIVLGDQITFLRDEWAMILERRGIGADVFLDEHAGHLAAGVVAYYKLVLAVFGMSSPAPFHVGSTLVYVVSGLLLFVYARRRVGGWLALMAACLILFFGAASVDLLSPFQIFFSASIAAGLGALLALDRRDGAGDALACILLVVSILFSETGIAFAAGAGVRIALERRALPARLYVLLLPVALYAVWWLGWGHTAESYLSLHNVADSPRYVLDAIGAAVASLLGLASASDALPAPSGQEWVPIALVVAVGLGAWRLRRLGTVPAGVWVAVAIGLTFWVSAAFNYFPGRAPGNGRYLYPSAVFVLLIAIELMRGARPRWPALLAAGAVTAVGLAGNLSHLADGYRYYFKPASEQQRAVLRALEDTGEQNPSFVLNASIAPVAYFDIPAGSYLDAVRDFGSPAYTQTELEAAPEDARAEADRVYGAVLGIELEPGGAVSAPCRKVSSRRDGETGIELAPGTVVGLRSAARGRAQVVLGRFSEGFPVDLGQLAPGATATLAIPRDGAHRPWRLGLIGAGERVRICGAGTRAQAPA